MTFDEFGVIAKTMKAVYTDPKFLPDTDALVIWLGFLQDIEAEAAMRAVRTYIATNKWPPTPADIRGLVVEQTTPEGERLNQQEAWSLVTKALRNSTYGFEEEYAALPEAVQKAVGSASNLHDWGQISDPDSMTVIQSQFQRAYRQVEERRKSEAALPVLDTLSKIGYSTQERIGTA